METIKNKARDMANAYRGAQGDFNGVMTGGYYAGFIDGAEWMKNVCSLEPNSNVLSGDDYSGAKRLNNVPFIEWAPCNLTGHGGMERNGNFYYTWVQAVRASLEVGGGWRLPTQREIGLLIDTESTSLGCIRRFDGELFLDAAGVYLYSTDEFIEQGRSASYWGYSPARGEDRVHYALTFYDDRVLLDSVHDDYLLSVRLVRDL